MHLPLKLLIGSKFIELLSRVLSSEVLEITRDSLRHTIKLHERVEKSKVHLVSVQKRTNQISLGINEACVYQNKNKIRYHLL